MISYLEKFYRRVSVTEHVDKWGYLDAMLVWCHHEMDYRYTWNLEQVFTFYRIATIITVTAKKRDFRQQTWRSNLL